MTTKMTPDEEHAFYANPANQVSVGRSMRRRGPLSDPVPVPFPDDLLSRVREQAEADDRSVSSWIRRAVEHELERNAG